MRPDRNCEELFYGVSEKAVLKQVKRLHWITKVLHKLNTKMWLGYVLKGVL